MTTRSIAALAWLPLALGFAVHGRGVSAAAAQPPPQAAAAATSPSSAPGATAPLVWLERAGTAGAAHGADKGALPLLRAITAGDPRLADANRLADNEPATFIRTLVARAWARYGLPSSWTEPRLAVLLEKGGNHARRGFRLEVADRVEPHPDVPYIVLELDSRSLSDTFLHEGGHLLHDIATRGRRPEPPWTPLPHTTFAVTDPLTALAEGFGIHLETLYGHYGRDAGKRAFYHRLAPKFDARGTRLAEFYAPIADLMTFSQSWARYQGVRDGWAAFAGGPYDGDYLRSQFDPSRDRSTLKPANAMLASEGIAASVLFWTAAGLAEARGASPGTGLAQQSLVEAEETLLAAMAASTGTPGQFRPDLIDVVTAIGERGSPERRLAAVRFVEITRGVTARPGLRRTWKQFYDAAIALDQAQLRKMFDALEGERVALHDTVAADSSVLRSGLGPILPVRAAAVSLEVKALGEAFPLEFDLNAATDVEWRAVRGVEPEVTRRILTERDARPFASLEDFEQRTGVVLSRVGLERAVTAPATP